MKTISLRELAAPWGKFPIVMLAFAAAWLLGAIGLTVLHVKFPPEIIAIAPDADVPGSMFFPVTPNERDFFFKCASSIAADCAKQNLSVSNSLHKDVIDPAGQKVGTIDDFLFGQDGKIVKVGISKNIDWNISNAANGKTKASGTIAPGYVDVEKIQPIRKNGKEYYLLALSPSEFEQVFAGSR